MKVGRRSIFSTSAGNCQEWARVTVSWEFFLKKGAPQARIFLEETREFFEEKRAAVANFFLKKSSPHWRICFEEKRAEEFFFEEKRAAGANFFLKKSASQTRIFFEEKRTAVAIFF